MERKYTDDKKEWRFHARALQGNTDRLVFSPDSKDLLNSEIKILDEHGIQVVYKEALNDMILLEEEMMKIGSHFLNKAELDKHLESEDAPSSMLDRA